jgi:hypothetical protein
MVWTCSNWKQKYVSKQARHLHCTLYCAACILVVVLVVRTHSSLSAQDIQSCCYAVFCTNTLCLPPCMMRLTLRGLRMYVRTILLLHVNTLVCIWV